MNTHAFQGLRVTPGVFALAIHFCFETRSLPDLEPTNLTSCHCDQLSYGDRIQFPVCLPSTLPAKLSSQPSELTFITKSLR